MVPAVGKALGAKVGVGEPQGAKVGVGEPLGAKVCFPSIASFAV